MQLALIKRLKAEICIQQICRLCKDKWNVSKMKHPLTE
jgi:hypothetical protein